ncbi:MAG: hypothetical protein Q9214_004573 [Letrouitia sp. 1 TL-2023]
MADIFPTGYFAGYNAFKELTREQISDSVVVLVGCGPVGLCALVIVEDYKPKHILAVDSVPSRLELAKSLGAESWNFQTDREDLDKRVKELTDGRGADVVIGREISALENGHLTKVMFRGRWTKSSIEDEL